MNTNQRRVDELVERFGPGRWLQSGSRLPHTPRGLVGLALQEVETLFEGTAFRVDISYEEYDKLAQKPCFRTILRIVAPAPHTNYPTGLDWMMFEFRGDKLQIAVGPVTHPSWSKSEFSPQRLTDTVLTCLEERLFAA